MRSGARLLTIAGLIVTLLLLAGCSGEIGIGSITTGGGGPTTSGDTETTAEAPQSTTTSDEAETTTEPPATTATSNETSTTAAPDAGEDTSDTTLYIVIGIIALVLLIIVISAISRSRRSKKTDAAAAAAAAGSPAAAAAATAWQATAERAYSQSRWLYENLTPEVAQWRGDSLHKDDTVSGDQVSDFASAQQQTWDQLGTQMTAASTTLYSLELQVDPAAQPVVRSLIDGLNRTRTYVDVVASARFAVHRATDALQGDSGNPRLQQELSAAHDHENQSVQNLSDNRAVLYGALANLAALK